MGDLALQDLLAVHAQLDVSARRERDPVGRVWRVHGRRDREALALVAASLAFGRVAAFGPVLDHLLGWSQEHGGPAQAMLGVARQGTRDFDALVYRWVRGPQVATLMASIGRLQDDAPAMGDLVRGDDAAAVLDDLVDRLRRAAGGRANDLDRLLSRPSGGSACKRMALFLRWMVRPEDGVDLGLWGVLPPSHLVVPLDTHLARIGRLVGLLHRSTPDWRAALELTDGLRRLDPDDPVRHDFALAHLGISGACRARFVPEICGACALRGACRAVAHST